MTSSPGFFSDGGREVALEALWGAVGDRWGGGSVPMHACRSSSLCVLLMIIILSTDGHHVITLTIFEAQGLKKNRMNREALEMDQHR